MFLGLGMKRARRSLRDRNDASGLSFWCGKFGQKFVALKQLQAAVGGKRQHAAKIRPGIDETGAALFSYRKYAGLVREPSKVTGGATLSHCTLGTYFGALPNTNLQQKSR